MYPVMYIRYAYFGSVMAIHSILTHPWNSALLGSSQTPALQHDISISAHVVVNAARSIILDTDVIHTDVSTPIWLALYFPLVSVINIFIYILKYPALPTAPSDLALLDIATGHFARLEFASPDIALPFVREIARLARATIEFTKNTTQSPGSLGQDLTLAAPQTFENYR
ncbi:fungal specific transcription protein [Penicillium psychrosexuale]|uniref:fungal specific transcription protein n=1 Tax=Penicillium psychrosexuale TaxID=1002107 RepID=UPI00254528CE|nr:fungal specific transcription protein [Penicillium psychrosexuale]KAJ5783771.1 fungal specific transcription protein [Penicillium psychrosexuale]